MSLLTENGHVLDVLLFQLVSMRGDSYACLFSDNLNDDPDPSKMNHVMKFWVLCKYNNIMVINILWLTTRRFFGYLLLNYIVWYSCIILFDGVWPYFYQEVCLFVCLFVFSFLPKLWETKTFYFQKHVVIFLYRLITLFLQITTFLQAVYFYSSTYTAIKPCSVPEEYNLCR